MKSILLSALFLMMSLNSFAQNINDKKIFLDSLWRETTNDYEYFRIIKNYNLVQDEYQFEDYFKSGKIQMKATSLDKETLTKNGESIYYYENGNIEKVVNYEKGIPFGKYASFYENGSKKEEGQYLKNETDEKKSGLLKIENYWNENKKQLVIKGNGVYKEIDSDQATLEGNLKNGFKDGLWKGKSKAHKFTFEEKYENGKLISGESIDAKGEKHEYSEIYQSPAPTKGYSDFYKFVSNNFRVPRLDEMNDKMILYFVVNKDSSVSNIKVIKSLTPELDKEGIRIVSLYKGWGVGKFRGIIVRTSFSIPIKIVTQ